MTEAMNSPNRLILKYPASWWGNMWREALPSGNGKIGAAVFGGVFNETILINHQELWHAGRKDAVPDISGALAKTRELMKEGRYQEANGIIADALKETGYQSRFASPLPVADLKLKMETKQGFRDYRRCLNMETGEVTVSWQDGDTTYQRAIFVSRAADLIAYQITADNGLVNFAITFDLHEQKHPYREDYQASLQVIADGEYLFYAATHQDGTDFGAVARIITSDGQLCHDQQQLIVKNAKQATILVKVFINGQRQTDWAALKAKLAAESKDYHSLLADHCQIHTALFNSVKLSLGTENSQRSNEELLLAAYEGEAPLELIEKMWAFGRYLFISSTRPDGLPAHMYGAWVGSYRAIWSHYMANENVQMIYWHALTGGLSQLLPALFNYYESMLDDFRTNARNIYGCRGIFIPAGTTPGIGVPCQVVPVIVNWTGAAGWLAQHFYAYYLYTGDLDFLKDKILPFMREAALFYEDFLELNEDGYYQVYPSVSPENSPRNFVTSESAALAHPMPSTINATMEIAIIKELFNNLIAGSKITGMYTEQVEKWEAILAKIPPYQINEEGAVREWIYPDFQDNYNHRHLSHLYPVFPGHEVTKETEPELFAAFEQAVKKRLVVGLSDQTGWSLAHMANIYARLGDGDSALECLDLLARSCIINNFFTLHNDWRNMGICLTMNSAPIQIDANLGWTAAVQEMLIYSSANLVRILPALPSKWNTGKVKNLHFCTGTVSFIWDKTQANLSVEITAMRDTNITLGLPAGFGKYKVECQPGQVQQLGEENYWQVQLPAGSQMKITSLRS